LSRRMTHKKFWRCGGPRSRLPGERLNSTGEHGWAIAAGFRERPRGGERTMNGAAKKSLGASPHKMGSGGRLPGDRSVCAKRCGRAQSGGRIGGDRKGTALRSSGDSSAPESQLPSATCAVCGKKRPFWCESTALEAEGGRGGEGIGKVRRKTVAAPNMSRWNSCFARGGAGGSVVSGAAQRPRRRRRVDLGSCRQHCGG